MGIDKAERRDKKRNKRFKMKTSGGSTRLLQQIVIDKARKAKEKAKQYSIKSRKEQDNEASTRV